MEIVDCSLERHGAQILNILNEAIINSTAIYDYKPRPAESMEGWFRTKSANNFPVLGVEDEHGELLGFSTYGAFRAWPAYKYTVELSLYVRADVRGCGFGRILLGKLIEVAQQRDCHVLMAGIDAENQISIALHERQGFVKVGIIQQCGFKFGRWLDLAFYQLILAGPIRPVDDV